METTTYGYGHTKEASALVRKALNDGLKREIKAHNLKISVRKADSGYGGPRVDITTNVLALDKCYQYIVDENGSPASSGKLVTRPCSEFPGGRPHYEARLMIPKVTEQLNARIRQILNQFGRSNDDIMTDYFDNTQPLFSGICYRR